MDVEGGEERYRSLFNNVPVAIWEEDISEVITMVDEVLDQGIDDFAGWLDAHPDFVRRALHAVRIRDVNEPALALYGADTREALIDHFYRMVSTDEALEVFKRDLRALASGARQYETEYSVQAMDGRRLHMLVRMYLPEEQPGRLILMEMDITARKTAEDRLRHVQRLDAVGQLTGGIAHDFNNLLTVVIGNVALLQDSLPEGSEERTLAELVEVAARRGADLTRQLLAFARKQPLQPRNVDVDLLTRNLQALIRSMLTPEVELAYSSADDLWMASVDPAQLETALMNLALNARDAMPEGGVLSIEVRNLTLPEPIASADGLVPAGDYVSIIVSDTGSGMDAKTASRAVEPFFTTKSVGEGSGLGLSMVHGFVHQSGGHLRITSAPAAGTRVQLDLPRARAAEDDRMEGRDLPAPRQAKGERILGVEDDDLLRQYITAEVRRRGYRVVAMPDASAALEAIEAGEDFDLLFTDIMMPGRLNGRQLAAAVARIQPDMPVLFSSGYSRDILLQRGRIAADTHFLQKPYRGDDLARQLREAVVSSPRQRDPAP